MSLLYKSLNSSVRWNGKNYMGLVSREPIAAFEALVDIGAMGRSDVADASILTNEAIPQFRFIKKATAKASLMNEGDTSGVIGASITEALLGKTVSYIKDGFFSILAGDADLADGASIVAGPYGKAVAYNAAQIQLVSEASIAGDDLDNSVWGSAGQKIVISTLASNSDDCGIAVTLFYIDDNGDVVSEVITTDTTTSTTSVTGQGTCITLLGYEPASVFTGTLQIKNEDGDTCKSIAAPTAIRYGFLEAGASGYYDTVDGHRIKLTCSTGALTGSIVIEWETNAGDTVYEIVDFTADASAFSTDGYKTCVGVFIGDDDTTTATWVITVEANTAPQILGTLEGAIQAAGYALIDFIVPDCSTHMIPFAGIQGSISAGGTKYIGPANTAEVATDIGFFVVPFAGSIQGMYATLETAPGGSTKIVLTMRKNGSDQDMEVTITGTATSGSIEGTDAFDVVAGDKISIKSVADGGIAAANLNITVLYSQGQ